MAVTEKPLGPLPPHTQMRDFLPPDVHRSLLAWVLDNEARFKPAKVTISSHDTAVRVNPEVRIAMTMRDLGPLREPLSALLVDALPSLMTATGTVGPEPRSLELELAAHGDGAHYRAHVDIPFGPNRAPLGATEEEDRVLSAVCYFHGEPKRFSGGALRLYRFGAEPTNPQLSPDDYVDLEPLQNSLVAFPSWATHEVRRVECPSGAFGDYRYALNCWYCRRL